MKGCVYKIDFRGKLKTNVLTIHAKPRTRRELKETLLFLDRNKKEQLNYTNHAKFLGITFSETGTFHKHINEVLKIAHWRIKQLHKFTGTVKGDTVNKVYKINTIL